MTDGQIYVNYAGVVNGDSIPNVAATNYFH